MGVEHYLVDTEGKNVLECGKWYALEARVDIDENAIPEGWRQPHVLSWIREVCGGRRVHLVTDCGVGDPAEFEDDHGNPLPGWNAWTLHQGNAAFLGARRRWPISGNVP